MCVSVCACVCVCVFAFQCTVLLLLPSYVRLLRLLSRDNASLLKLETSMASASDELRLWGPRVSDAGREEGSGHGALPLLLLLEGVVLISSVARIGGPIEPRLSRVSAATLLETGTGTAAAPAEADALTTSVCAAGPAPSWEERNNGNCGEVKSRPPATPAASTECECAPSSEWRSREVELLLLLELELVLQRGGGGGGRVSPAEKLCVRRGSPWRFNRAVIVVAASAGITLVDGTSACASSCDASPSTSTSDAIRARRDSSGPPSPAPPDDDDAAAAYDEPEDELDGAAAVAESAEPGPAERMRFNFCEKVVALVGPLPVAADAADKAEDEFVPARPKLKFFSDVVNRPMEDSAPPLDIAPALSREFAPPPSLPLINPGLLLLRVLLDPLPPPPP